MYTETMLAPDSPLRSKLPQDQLELIEQGFTILKHANDDKSHKYDDYSFTVFPFAKAFEGFLKMVFLQAGYITREDYLSKFFRIGKVMSPNLRKRLGRNSVYERMCQSVGCEISDLIWKAWKRGRNQVFHYFPDNIQSITLQEAEDIAHFMINTMEKVVTTVRMDELKKKLSDLSMHEVKKLRQEKEAI